jgi:hypothetical protein
MLQPNSIMWALHRDAHGTCSKVRLLRPLRSGAWEVEPLRMDGTSRRIRPWHVQPEDLLPLEAAPC